MMHQPQEATPQRAKKQAATTTTTSNSSQQMKLLPWQPASQPASKAMMGGSAKASDLLKQVSYYKPTGSAVQQSAAIIKMTKSTAASHQP